jgi:hypothetical protein
MAARIVGWLGVDYVDTWVKAIAVGLAAMFVLTGVAHFVPPLRGSLIAIVPPRLPAPIASQLYRGAGTIRRGGPVGSGYPDRGRRLPAAVDAGDVPGQHLRGADAQPAQVDDDPATPAHR